MRSQRRARAAAVFALASACSAAPATAVDVPSDASWLRVEAPAEAESATELGLVEVRGQAAKRGLRPQDFVIVIDVSESTLLPSGWDVDADGPRGRTDPALLERLGARSDVPPGLLARLAESDFEDSVLAAELAAAQALIDRLDLDRYRVGLVAFSDEAKVLAPLGSNRERLSAALADLRDDFPSYLRGTNFGDAVTAAQLALAPPDGMPPPDGRERSILFLSDGEPTLPPHGDNARHHALWAAHAAAAAGIRIHAFELRATEHASAAGNVFAKMAETSGGHYERLQQAGDAIARLRRTDLVGLAELRVVNETTDRPARALRTFPDGSFDAFVELAPGRNRIRFEAAASDGTRAVADRIVDYDAAPPRDAAQARERREQTEALLDQLRRRTQETEVWAQMERERRVRKLEIEIHAGDR